MTDPVVDVLIPVYNAAPTLQPAVRSIQQQTVRDIRIIVADDRVRRDATPGILARLAEADPGGWRSSWRPAIG